MYVLTVLQTRQLLCCIQNRDTSEGAPDSSTYLRCLVVFVACLVKFSFVLFLQKLHLRLTIQQLKCYGRQLFHQNRMFQRDTLNFILRVHIVRIGCLQCLDTVGWAAGRASSL